MSTITKTSSPAYSGSGNLRAFSQMGESKFAALVEEMGAWATIDPDGYKAVMAEAEARGLTVPEPPANADAAPPEPEGLTFVPQKAAPTKGDPAKLLSGSPDLFMEYKFDGWRMIAIVTTEGTELYARTGTRLTDHVPHIAQVISDNVPPGTILDGEAGVQADNWGEVQGVLSGHPKEPERAGQVGFFVFDCLQWAGEDLMGQQLHIRHQYLDRTLENIPLFQNGMAGCWPVPRWQATDEVYQRIVWEGYEGAVIKRLDSVYRPGVKGGGWTKLKVIGTEDVVIMGFNPGEGERGQQRLLGSIEFGQYRDGELVSRGNVGGGFDDETARWLWAHRSQLIGRVAEISHFGVNDGFRHPQWVRLRDPRDKKATDCVWS